MNQLSNILPAFYPITMRRRQVACFLPVIISLTWSACQTLPKAIRDMVIARAGARALRVGIGKHAQHVNQAFKPFDIHNLHRLHASPIQWRHYVIACSKTMPFSLFGSGMFVGYPSPCQPFISLTACPACALLANTITEHDYLPAPARARYAWVSIPLLGMLIGM